MLEPESDEIAKLLASGSTGRHGHSTWAQTFSSFPELYFQPESLEEVQKIVHLARRCRKRIVVVGSGHSPSDLTCTSSWMINLDGYGNVLKVDKSRKTLLVQAGIRMRDLNKEANKHGLTMPNLGSIDEQSIAGAISTGTHGSSLKHGLLSESVRSLKIVLSNGTAVKCSADQNEELFRAALLSLGALGIIVEVEFEMVDACNIEWEQALRPLSEILKTWDTTLWTQKEFTRVWWMPYMKRAIVWSAEKTSKPLRAPKTSWYGGAMGYHVYHNLLFVSNYIPAILPWVEWFVFGMQYGFKPGATSSAVEPLQSGLLMDCLYSQFVNEWAIPLSKGPEALQRLSDWMNGTGDKGRIPFSARGLYVHCPIEVRVSDTSNVKPKPYLDITPSNGPTLYLNATLYRPHHQDPPCRWRYYEAFEWLMKELDGKPHWAKNFSYTSRDDIKSMYGDRVTKWADVRNKADPEGMFIGEWHRRTLPLGESRYALEEHEVSRVKNKSGGQSWSGRIEPEPRTRITASSSSTSLLPESPSASSSGESYDMMQVSEFEKATYDGDDFDDEDEGELTDKELRQ